VFTLPSAQSWPSKRNIIQLSEIPTTTYVQISMGHVHNSWRSQKLLTDFSVRVTALIWYIRAINHEKGGDDEERWDEY
jgi:hypothetical protein